MSKIRFALPPTQRLLLLILTYIAGMAVTAIVAGLLLRAFGDSRYVAMLRISTVLQDMFMLVVPAVLTAVLSTRTPASLLAIDRLPSTRMTPAALAVMIVSAPAMTYIINLNASIELPEAWRGIEESLRAMEENATQSIASMTGAHNIPNLIVNILIIGVLAGVSEELFFRGALQRLLQSMPMGATVAVWVTAIVFSAVHLQFYGFVPRMLLGAYFGYLLLWSGSVWLPVMAHALNNIMYVVLSYTTGSGDPELGAAGIATWVIPAVSAALTAAMIAIVYRLRPGAAGRLEE